MCSCRPMNRVSGWSTSRDVCYPMTAQCSPCWTTTPSRTIKLPGTLRPHACKKLIENHFFTKFDKHEGLMLCSTIAWFVFSNTTRMCDANQSQATFHLFLPLLLHPSLGFLLLFPRWIRGEHFKYKFSQPGSASAAQGKWWLRKRIGAYFPAVDLEGLRGYFQSRNWPHPHIRPHRTQREDRKTPKWCCESPKC